MAQQPKTIEVEAYLTIEPKFRSGTGTYSTDDHGRPILEGARISSVTAKAPTKATRSGTFVTKVRMEIEAECFLPLLPTAEIHIGPGDAQTVILVEAQHPGDLPD